MDEDGNIVGISLEHTGNKKKDLHVDLEWVFDG
jgi:hypothetical protein